MVRVRWTATQPWQRPSFRHPRYTLRRSSIQVFLGLWTPNKSSVSVLETLPVKLRIHMCNLRSWVCRVNTVESWLGAEGFAVSLTTGSHQVHCMICVLSHTHPHPRPLLFCFSFPLTSFSPLGECCGELWSKPQWFPLIGLTNGHSRKRVYERIAALQTISNAVRPRNHCELKKKKLEYSK